ncbi:MAG: hypothetical protein M5U12_29020 [Verrucomicrobia bacterium]|nr:hypothetical protein [Verrucomicrobiota bacterium]
MSVPRRRFLATTAAATGFTVLKPATVFGAAANSQIAVGLIGCGGRGGWIADLFVKTGKYRLVAVADYFQDKIDTVGNRLGSNRPGATPGSRVTSGCWRRRSTR